MHFFPRWLWRWLFLRGWIRQSSTVCSSDLHSERGVCGGTLLSWRNHFDDTMPCWNHQKQHRLDRAAKMWYQYSYLFNSWWLCYNYGVCFTLLVSLGQTLILIIINNIANNTISGFFSFMIILLLLPWSIFDQESVIRGRQKPITVYYIYMQTMVHGHTENPSSILYRKMYVIWNLKKRTKKVNKLTYMQTSLQMKIVLPTTCCC